MTTISVTIDGETYKSKATDEIEHRELADKIYDMIADTNRFKLELENGGWLVLGEDAVQRAQFVFCK